MACASVIKGITGYFCCAFWLLPNSTAASGSKHTVASCGFLHTGSFHRAALRFNCAREWSALPASVAPPGVAAPPFRGDLELAEAGFIEEELISQVEPTAGEGEGVPPAAAVPEQATTGGTRTGGVGEGYAGRRKWDPRSRRAAKRPPFARDVVVTLDQLVPGTVFSGKVIAIESFGAFIDIGAFTDGLLHISQIKDDFIADVRDYVTKGQEVKVKVTAVDADHGRISLTMRGLNEEDGTEAPRGQEERRQRPVSRAVAQSVSGKIEPVQGRPVRSGKIAGRGKQETKQTAKAVGVTKGQEVKGVVKSITKNGVFLALDSGDDAYLRASDAQNPSNLAMESLYKVGQSLEARVMRIEAGRISLTMKKEVDLTQMNMSINNNESFKASNPFQLAFRQANILVVVDQLAGLDVDVGEAQHVTPLEVHLKRLAGRKETCICQRKRLLCQDSGTYFYCIPDDTKNMWVAFYQKLNIIIDIKEGLYRSAFRTAGSRVGNRVFLLRQCRNASLCTKTTMPLVFVPTPTPQLFMLWRASSF